MVWSGCGRSPRAPRLSNKARDEAEREMATPLVQPQRGQASVRERIAMVGPAHFFFLLCFAQVEHMGRWPRLD
jgi:hypothetical protein